MNWKETEIIKVCDILGGKPAPSSPEAFSSDGIPFVRMKDLGRYHLTTNLNKTEECISHSYAKKYKFNPIPKGAILLPRSGSVALNHRAILGQDSIIVSHICALVVKDSSELNNRFLYYLLCRYDMNRIAKKTTGLDALNFSDLGNIKISYPDLETQIKIVAILDKANDILEKKKKSILLFDKLLKSTFFEIFGDVANNTKGWEKMPLREFGDIITGNTPPRNDKSNYDSEFIEWIKTSNIIHESPTLTEADEYLSEKGFSKSRYVDANALLVACIAGSIGSIGRSAITNRKVAFNQQINAIVPNNDVSVHFLYWMFKLSSEYIQSFATKGMKRLITKGEFEKIPFIKPDHSLQMKFEKVALFYASLINKIYSSKLKFEYLLSSLSQQAFEGELEFNTAVDLEVLLENDYEFFKKNSNTKSIQLLLERLDKDELNEKKFYEQEIYEKAKGFVFELLKEGKVKQVFEKERKRVKLTV